MSQVGETSSGAKTNVTRSNDTYVHDFFLTSFPLGPRSSRIRGIAPLSVVMWSNQPAPSFLSAAHEEHPAFTLEAWRLSDTSFPRRLLRQLGVSSNLIPNESR